MKKRLKGLLKLTRFNEYLYFVIITTLLGAASAGGNLDWRLIVVLAANWTAVGFAFMINIVEDAPDDAFLKEKANCNPVSAGMITPKAAYRFSYSVAGISALLFGFLGTWPFILGLLTLILGFLHANRHIRLKNIAFFDLLSHSMMLAGLQFLCSYFSYSTQFSMNWYWPFVFLVMISIYKKLSSEIHDLKEVQAAQCHHTAAALGEKTSHILILIVLIIATFSGMVTFFLINLIPYWVLIIMAILAVIFITPVAVKTRRSDKNIAIQSAFQKPLERAAALALILQFILPRLNQFFPLGFL